MLNDDISCITTNCDYIPLPHLGGNRAVVEHTDHFFAQDDFLLWPQPYHTSLPHLPFIHCRELDIYESKIRSFLWDLPDRDHEFIHDNGICIGLGQLSRSRFSQFLQFDKSLQQRAKELHIIPTDYKLLEGLILETRALLTRLDSLKMGYRSLCRTVRALQRNLLEIEAFLDYLSVTNEGSLAPRVTVGAFVTEIDHVQLLRRQGINHWLICPFETVLQSHIEAITTMRYPQDLGFSTEVSSNAIPIYVGSASHIKLYQFIKEFGRRCIKFPDPFHSHCVPEPVVSDASWARSGSQRRQRALTLKQRKKKSAPLRK